MLRSFFIYLAKADWARRMITGWSISRRVAGRFIAGETLDDALAVIRNLNQLGINATIDHLGENTNTPDEAQRALDDICVALDGIEQAGLRANVSVKLTQIGLQLDPALCAQNLASVLAHARNLGSFIRVDMEDSPVTQITLDIVRQMRTEGFDNVGVVLQAYLYRSPDDARQLSELGIPLRLCKGAYKEPSNVAFPKKANVDSQLDDLARISLDAAIQNQSPEGSQDGKLPPQTALATHDEIRIQHAKAYVAEKGIPKKQLEFQMLHGIRRDLQVSLVSEGYPVRVYVPYGTQWYPYFMRRLGERPANIWFFVTNFFRK